MKTTTLLLLCLVIALLLLDSSDAWGRRRRRSRGRSRRRGSLTIGSKGVNYNRGRHNINVNHRGGNYNYKGNRWNAGAGYNRRNGRINFGGNRGNHNFKGNYNHRNKNWGLGYTWRFGRKRRDLGTSEDVQRLAQVRLGELGDDVTVIKTLLSTLVPNIKHVTLPTHKEPITDQVLAQDILCLVHQFGKILPQLEAFTKKMFTKHSFAYGVKVDAHFENVPGCKAIEPPPKGTLDVLTAGDLAEMKTFVGALILTRLELKAALPQEKTQ